MNWKRLKHCFSPSRFEACRRLFRHPWSAHVGLAFLGRRPVQVSLKNGRSLSFCRADRDHIFWDWMLRQPNATLDFTPDGELVLPMPNGAVCLRRGTFDFLAFREIFVEDGYDLPSLPARLGTVVDLGGNIGLFTCAVLPRADRVITVEPVEANHRLARKNVLRNGGNPADVLRYAVSGQSGREVAIHLAPRNTLASSVIAGFVPGMHGAEIVPTISLSDLLDWTGVSTVGLLKCDVEGAEFDLFAVAPLAVLKRINRVIIELHLNVDPDGTKERVLIARLRDAGMDVTVEEVPSWRPAWTRMLSARRT
jgi:FkbM family methyltransferase